MRLSETPELHLIQPDGVSVCSTVQVASKTCPNHCFRKTLSIPGLLKKVKAAFSKIKDHRKKKPDYPLVDVLMSGLAVFGTNASASSI
ncbi:MAG: hypothetical protein V2J55_18365 [Candidatus Competibacteraceae bacterium]|jgi:hypothetical protein|nr:hypothetical protein [Candidatus Competibacteraceae bacterium]